MGKVFRGILAVLVGFVAAFVVVAIGEFAGMAIFPPPPGTDFSTPEAIAKAMPTIATGAKLAVVIAWGAGALVGALATSAIANRARLTHAMIFGGLFLLVTLGNLASFPHPAWMWMAGLAEILPAAFIGGWLIDRRYLSPKSGIAVNAA